MKVLRYKAKILSFSALTIAMHSASSAQTAGSPPVASSPNDEIVVTAQRRAESSTNVPISISTVSPKLLQEAGVTSFGDLEKVVPGLSITASGPYAQPTIRGVGSQVAGPGLPSNVATYVDDVYRPSATMISSMGLGDVAGITVLKGPQGTLYGRNATGGAILIETGKPSFSEQANARLDYGSYNTVSGHAFLTGPVTDRLALSAYVSGGRSDGYVRNISTHDNDAAKNWNFGTRLKALYRPSDTVKFTLTYEFSKINDPTPYAVGAYKGETTAALFPGAIVASRPNEISTNYPPQFKSHSNVVSLHADVDLGIGTLTSVSAGQWEKFTNAFDADFSNLTLAHYYFPGSNKNYSEDLFLTSKDGGRLQWTTGLSFNSNLGVAAPFLLITAAPPPLVVTYGQTRNNSIAGYADGTYEILSKLFITGGLRYSRDYLKIGVASVGGGYVEQRGHKSYDGLSPRAVVRYQLTDQANVYASYSQGFKSGAYNLYGGTTVPVRPETVKSYEVGFKMKNGGFSLDAAAFYSDYKNLQLDTYSNNVAILVNAARARIYGAEVQARIPLADRLSLAGGMTYINAKYRSFPDAQHIKFDPLVGIVNFADVASGNTIPNSPKFSGNASLNYAAPLWGGGLELSATGSYHSKTNYDSFGEFSQKAYALLDLQAQWTLPNRHWSIGVNGSDVTDKHHLSQAFGANIGVIAVYAAPRIIKGFVTYKM